MAEGAGHAAEREGGGVGLRSFVLSSGRVGGFDGRDNCWPDSFKAASALALSFYPGFSVLKVGILDFELSAISYLR